MYVVQNLTRPITLRSTPVGVSSEEWGRGRGELWKVRDGSEEWEVSGEEWGRGRGGLWKVRDGSEKWEVSGEEWTVKDEQLGVVMRSGGGGMSTERSFRLVWRHW